MMSPRIALIGVAAILAFAPLATQATIPDYAVDVRIGNPGPTPNPAVSNLDNYINQDEQLNLSPTDGNIRILRTNQKVMLNDFVSTIIPLEHAKPRELRGPIRTIVRKEGGEADALHDATNGKNYLQVTCPSWQMPYVERAVRALDVEWIKERHDGSAEMYYPMRFRDVDRVLNITRFYVSPEFRFHVDKTNNALYYRDQPPLMGLQTWGLGQIDIPPSQMMMDVAIYEVSTANNLLLGADYISWKNGPGRRLFEAAVGYSREVIRTNTPGGSTRTTNEQGPFVYGSFSAVVTSAYVDFLRVKGKARLLNRAQITAKSGTVGRINAVEELVAFRRTLAPPPTPPDRPHTFVDDKNGVQYHTIDLPGYRARSLDYAKSGTVGVQVRILPVIGQKSSEVEVSVDVSDVTGFTPAGTPIIKSRSVDSKIRMYPGEPYVIAGLNRKAELSATNKVPILGSIPVLGWLFGQETESKSESQVVVVLTPSVSVSAESIIEMPAEARTAIAIVELDGKVEIPCHNYGFDQWLLDN